MFLNSEYFNAGWQIVPKSTINYNGMHVKKYIIIKVSWDNIDLTDLITKQTEFNLDIIQSIWYFQDEVSFMISPQNFV
jgi:hypothetical protein